MRRELYPDNWPEISQRIRERAKNRCEWCGARNKHPHPVTGSIVVLTVAHLDHGKKDCSDANLAALCQRCHLSHDLPQHLLTRAANRRQEQLQAGQLWLVPPTNSALT